MAVDVEDLVRSIREYRGVTRKSSIEAVARSLIPSADGNLVAAMGEDAAAIRSGKEIILFAADGILSDLVGRNPTWAGYCSILVNANDIAAMGGVPIAAVNVLSCGSASTRAKIVRGMRDASAKLGVPIVGGHLHPDTDYSAVDVAMIGRTTDSRLVLSSTARAGDSIVFAMDLKGRFTRGIPYSWDTTSMKSGQDVRRRLLSMHRVAPKLSAGKDISNPGSLGTLGMLLEASSRGGQVLVDHIPRPGNVGLVQWLLAYQGCGFVTTCLPEDVRSVLRSFRSSGLAAAECGSVTRGRRLRLEHNGSSGVLFDFHHDRLGGRTSQKI